MTEREILDIFYPDYNDSQIDKKEDPDYYLSHKNGHQFGVEITRYFHSESSARLKYIPRYGLDLLNGKPYKHKDDKTELPVEDMIIHSSKDGTEKKIKGIFRDGRSLVAISNNLASIIKTKNRKHKKYNKKLTHINLLIYDSENFFQSIEKGVYNFLIADSIIKETRNSPFREIFFITHNKNKVLGYIPIKLFQISSYIACFKKIFILFAEKYGLTKSLKNYYEHLIKYLSYLDYAPIHYRITKDTYHIYFGNTAFTINDSKYKFDLLGDELFPFNTKKANIKKEKDSFDRRYIPIINDFYSNTIGYIEIFINMKNAI